MQLANASCALAALDALHERLPVAMQDIRRGLLEVELPGRFQVLPGRPTLVLDVAHNPQAARVLADNLGDMAFHPTTWAVFGMLRDKDVAGVIDGLEGARRRLAALHARRPPCRQRRLSGGALEAAGFRVGGRFASPAAALV